MVLGEVYMEAQSFKIAFKIFNITMLKIHFEASKDLKIGFSCNIMHICNLNRIH
jgi:hypothetical protein